MVLVTPHLVKPMAQGVAQLPTDAYVEPNDVEFYLLGQGRYDIAYDVRHAPFLGTR